MGQLPGEEKMKFSFKGYLKSMFSLCRNKVFMLIVFGTTIRMLYTIGMFTFLIKILILKFGVAPSKAGQSLGFIMMPSLIGECLLDQIQFTLWCKVVKESTKPHGIHHRIYGHLTILML